MAEKSIFKSQGRRRLKPKLKFLLFIDFCVGWLTGWFDLLFYLMIIYRFEGEHKLHGSWDESLAYWLRRRLKPKKVFR